MLVCRFRLHWVVMPSVSYSSDGCGYRLVLDRPIDAEIDARCEIVNI